MAFRQIHHTRGDVENSNNIAMVAGGNLVTTKGHTIHPFIMNLVFDQISAQQVPLTNMPYNKLINESVPFKPPKITSRPT